MKRLPRCLLGHLAALGVVLYVGAAAARDADRDPSLPPEASEAVVPTGTAAAAAAGGRVPTAAAVGLSTDALPPGEALRAAESLARAGAGGTTVEDAAAVAAQALAAAQEAQDAKVEERVDALLAGLTLEQKVGQLMFVGFGGVQVDPGGQIEQLVQGKQVGGVALFSRNVKGTRQIAAFTRQIADLLPDLPPFIAVDQEGGNVVRLDEPATVLPSNMALGAVRDPTLTRRAAASQARDLHLLGFNMNLAPVLDVNSNPANPVIGIRSFGEDPALVGEHGAAYVRGLQSEHVSGVAKHFPGHGDTSSDSHYALPSLPHGRERLLAVELAPFKAAVDAGLDAVMTAHIALPAVEGEPQVPATVSHKVLTGLLRETLGFEGIIVTDGLEMKGIVEAYGSGVAAVKAIQAGADMVLILWFPEKKEEVHQALLTAVRTGEISHERLDASVRRILRVKVRRGLFDAPPPPLDAALAELGDGHRGREISQEVARRALTLVRGRSDLTPLSADRRKGVLVVSASAAFADEMTRQFPGATLVETPSVPSRRRLRRDTDRALKLAAGSEVVVVGVMNDYQVRMVRALEKAGRPLVVVSLGSPYLLADFPKVDAYVCAYSYQPTAARAAARFLSGRGPAPGRLPVTLPGLYPLGHTAATHPDPPSPGPAGVRPVSDTAQTAVP